MIAKFESEQDKKKAIAQLENQLAHTRQTLANDKLTSSSRDQAEMEKSIYFVTLKLLADPEYINQKRDDMLIRLRRTWKDAETKADQMEAEAKYTRLKSTLSCKKCYGRGYDGFMPKQNIFHFCSCFTGHIHKFSTNEQEKVEG